MSLILPCAGSSTPYETQMVINSTNIKFNDTIHGFLNLTNIKDIYITCLKEHVEKYDLDIHNLFKIQIKIFMLSSG